MSGIFTTNSQADYLLRQQRAARPGMDFGAKRAEKPVLPAAASSNEDFLKATADTRALEKARSSEPIRSSTPDNSRDMASTEADRPAYEARPAADESVKKTDKTDKADLDARTDSVGTRDDSHEQSRVASDEAPLSGDTPSEGTPHDNAGVGAATTEDSTEETAEFVKTLGLGGSEVGLLNAYLSQNNTTKKPDTTPAKATSAYEAVVASLDSEEVVTLSNMQSGELPKMVNAKAGAYAADTPGDESLTETLEDTGVVSTTDNKGVDGGGLNSILTDEELAAILEGEGLDDVASDKEAPKVSGDTSDDKGLLSDKFEGENIAGLGGEDGSEAAAGDDNNTEEAGRNTKQSSAANNTAASLKGAYVEAHTEEKGVENKEGQESAATTQKTSDSSAKKTASQPVAPAAEQVNLSVEELTVDLGEAVDSAELVEAVNGKGQGMGSGLSKDQQGSGGQKFDMASMKNDGKAEGIAQAKEANNGVEAAKKTTATPKTFNYGKLQEGVFSTVDRGIRLSLANGGQDAKLTLRPESLGELRIKLTIGDDGQVQSKIMVDNAAVKNILDSDSARLKNMFSEQGLTLESYSVEVGDGWNGKSAKGGSGFDFNGRGSQRAYNDGAGAGTVELDPSVIAAGAYGGVSGGGLDLFA